MLAIILIASTAILLLRRANIERAQLLETTTAGRPAAPVVQVRSPAFVATHSGARYHVGCIVGEQAFEYGLWTTRSHRVVETYEPSEDGWSQAWARYLRLEHDPGPAWIDHRGAPRSRREWSSQPAGGVTVAAAAGRSNPTSGP
jgi:hypothetical protein